MNIFQLGSFPIEQEPDLDGLEWRLGQWFADRTFPVRLLAFSRRFDIRPARQPLERNAAQIGATLQALEPLRQALEHGGSLELALRALNPTGLTELEALLKPLPQLWQRCLAVHHGAPSDHALAEALGQAVAYRAWPLRWLRETSDFYTVLEQGHLRSATYLLLTWEPTDVSADGLASTLSQAFQRPARRIEQLPTLLACEYHEQSTWLQPERAGAPYLAALLSYDMRGTIDATTLHALLDAPYDLALAIDVQTPNRARAMRQVELAHNAARSVVNDARLKDARAERAEVDSQHALHELTRQGLHDVQLTVLVAGETREELEAHVVETRDRLGSALRLMRPAGVQAEILKLWSTTPSSQIDLPWKRRNMYSQGLGCLAGVTGYHRASGTAGLLYGVDGRRRAPLFLDLFADRQAAHMVVLGKTGYGKTFFLNTTALRAAALSGQRVIMFDAFENAARMELAAGVGAKANWITPRTAINILDIVFDQHTEGDWIASQTLHVTGQVALLLGTPGTGPDGRRRYTPYQLSIGERSVLEMALMDLYKATDPQTPTGDMPRLDDLIRVLDAIGEPEARALADLLCTFLHGTASRSVLGRTDRTRNEQTFNRPTEIDWRFSRALNCFDFAAVTKAAPELLPFYYAQAVGAVNRFMRDPRRDPRQRTLLIIDEYGYAAQVEAVGRLAAEICKVARKFGIGLMVVDQNPSTFLESQAGREIIENAAAKILFHLDDAPARQMAEAISDLTPGHVEFLSHAGRGETIAVFGNDVHLMLVEPSRLELRMFSGS
jgi:hypothetical protein